MIREGRGPWEGWGGARQIKWGGVSAVPGPLGQGKPRHKLLKSVMEERLERFVVPGEPGQSG